MLYIFDMGGVVTTTCKIEKELEKILKISWKEFLRFCGVKNENETTDSTKENLMSLCSDGKISCREFWERFSENSGIKVKTDWWHWLFHPELNTQTVEIIRTLKQRKNRVVCGTNTIDSHWKNHMERGDYSYFDQTYASCFMGISKPHPDFWNIILTAEKALPEETVFIDDRIENCRAAEALGIKAVHFINAAQLKEELL